MDGVNGKNDQLAAATKLVPGDPLIVCPALILDYQDIPATSEHPATHVLAVSDLAGDLYTVWHPLYAQNVRPLVGLTVMVSGKYQGVKRWQGPYVPTEAPHLVIREATVQPLVDHMLAVFRRRHAESPPSG